jgi:hypothetical protein
LPRLLTVDEPIPDTLIASIVPNAAVITERFTGPQEGEVVHISLDSLGVVVRGEGAGAQMESEQLERERLERER